MNSRPTNLGGISSGGFQGLNGIQIPTGALNSQGNLMLNPNASNYFSGLNIQNILQKNMHSLQEPNEFLNEDNLSTFEVEVPQKKSNLDYYNEYSKLYVYNFVLTAHAKDLYKELKNMVKKFQTITVSANLNLEQANPDLVMGQKNGLEPFKKQKRKRRRKDEVNRDYQCIVSTCKKSYG